VKKLPSKRVLEKIINEGEDLLRDLEKIEFAINRSSKKIRQFVHDAHTILKQLTLDEQQQSGEKVVIKYKDEHRQ
jgi:hypothetical protein